MFFISNTYAQNSGEQTPFESPLVASLQARAHLKFKKSTENTQRYW